MALARGRQIGSERMAKKRSRACFADRTSSGAKGSEISEPSLPAAFGSLYDGGTTRPISMRSSSIRPDAAG